MRTYGGKECELPPRAHYIESIEVKVKLTMKVALTLSFLATAAAFSQVRNGVVVVVVFAVGRLIVGMICGASNEQHARSDVIKFFCLVRKLFILMGPLPGTYHNQFAFPIDLEDLWIRNNFLSSLTLRPFYHFAFLNLEGDFSS